jgi:hypothetical protein
MAEKETPEKKQAAKAKPVPATPAAREEVGGRNGPEPTRYGDWEVKGICSDF